jgi:hypothetical protein
MAQGFNLQSFITSVVIVGVTLVIGIYVTEAMQTVMLNSSNGATNASNAAGSVVTALSTGTSWISILVVVGFATIILTMLTSGLGNAANETGTPYY